MYIYVYGLLGYMIMIFPNGDTVRFIETNRNCLVDGVIAYITQLLYNR